MRICNSMFALVGFTMAGFTMALSADTTGLLKEETEFAPRNGRFTITLPAGDTGDLSRGISLSLPSGMRFRKGKGRGGAGALEASRSKLRDGTIFIAVSIGIPSQIAKEISAEKRMDLYRDLFVTNRKGKVTGEKEIKQGDWTGKEFAIEFPETRMRMQLYVEGGFGLYAMVEAATLDRLQAKDVDDFFTSFVLTPKDKQ